MDNNSDKNKQEEQVEGTVIEALPEATFKIVIDGKDEEVIGYLSGKMRMHRIRVLVGDKVLIKTDPYGGKARIYKRV